MRLHVLKWLPESWTSLGQNEMLRVRWAGIPGRETTAPQTVCLPRVRQGGRAYGIQVD